MRAIVIAACLAFASPIMADPGVHMENVMGKAFMPAVAIPQPETPAAPADAAPVASSFMSNRDTSIAHLRRGVFKMEDSHDRTNAELEGFRSGMTIMAGPQRQAMPSKGQGWTSATFGFEWLGVGMGVAFLLSITYMFIVKGIGRAAAVSMNLVDGAALPSSAMLPLPASLSADRCTVPRMMEAGAPRYVDGARIGPPPDLPSLLLSNRIVYLGAPLVPEVTELIVAELLFLNYESTEKPIYLYINSVGTSLGNQIAAFETEAFAIIDVMNFVKAPVETICVGQAFGTAAMILASGAPGKRACLPNASLMLRSPIAQTQGQASDIAIAAREVIQTRQTILEILSEKTGQSIERIQADSSRAKYFSPEEAKAYGIVDKVLVSEDLPTTQIPSW